CNLQSHKEQYGRENSFRDELYNKGNVAQHPSQPDKDRYQKRVSRPGSHPFIRRVSDVRTRLGHSSAYSCNQSRNSLSKKYLSRIEGVTGHASTFSNIYPSHNRENGKGHRDREVFKRRDHAIDEVQGGYRQSRLELQARHSIASPQLCIKAQVMRSVIEQGSDNYRSEYSRNVLRQTKTGNERVQNNPES